MRTVRCIGHIWWGDVYLGVYTYPPVDRHDTCNDLVIKLWTEVTFWSQIVQFQFPHFVCLWTIRCKKGSTNV